jgi:hypothetical protein
VSLELGGDGVVECCGHDLWFRVNGSRFMDGNKLGDSGVMGR